MAQYGIPITHRRHVESIGPSEGLLLVAHGSRCVRSDIEMEELAGLVRTALSGVAVEVGYLELADPPAGAVLDRMVRRGCTTVTVLPLVLLGAGHAKSDVPAVILDGRSRHPGVEMHFGSPLGVGREPVELLGSALLATGAAGLPLLVVARGSSDPDANADAHKAARLLAEWTQAPFVHVGFSGVTGPSVEEAAGVFPRLGYDRVAVAWWFLCHGKLIENGRATLAGVSARLGVQFADAGHIGPSPSLVPLIISRYEEARIGRPSVNCDTCAYRAPWPGREARVGQALGIGHSHLAAAHRHPH